MHFLAVTDWQGPVASDQQGVHFVASSLALKVPRGHFQHEVDPVLEAKVPRRHPMHAEAPAPINIENGQQLNLVFPETGKDTRIKVNL
jgi:hypothetical protein